MLTNSLGNLRDCKFPLTLATCNLTLKMGLLPKLVLTSTILVPLHLIIDYEKYLS